MPVIVEDPASAPAFAARLVGPVEKGFGEVGDIRRSAEQRDEPTEGDCAVFLASGGEEPAKAQRAQNAALVVRRRPEARCDPYARSMLAHMGERAGDERRARETVARQTYAKPRSLRCSLQSAAKWAARRIRVFALSCAGWRPSTIAATMSGARKARRRTI